MWNVVVSPACVGSTVCRQRAMIFAIGPDGRSPLPSHTEPDDAVLAVAATCPMEAIAVSDAGASAPAQP
jgi:ferredoxin